MTIDRETVLRLGKQATKETFNFIFKDGWEPSEESIAVSLRFATLLEAEIMKGAGEVVAEDKC